MSEQHIMAHQLEGSENPLESLHDTIAFSSADWGAARDLAWIYGIVVGWDDPDPEDDARAEVAARFGWSPERVARLNRLRAAWVALEQRQGGKADGSRVAQLTDILAEQLFDRGFRVPDWPEDEQALFRDHTAWTDFADRAAKVQRLRFEKAAGAVLAAGWRPPARVIETAEEAAALPHGVIVESADGTIACRFDADRGVVFGVGFPFPWAMLALPLTVLREPEVQG